MKGSIRNIALIAHLQAAVRGLHRLRVSRETLKSVWPVERWSEHRIALLELEFKVYFRRSERETYTGAYGMPGFNGFTLYSYRRPRSGSKPLEGALQLLVPDKLHEYCSYDDHEWTTHWSDAHDVLAFNLLILQSSANPWMRR